MKPISEIQQETAQTLATAVAEVTRRALQPELEPFRTTLSELLDGLEEQVAAVKVHLNTEKTVIEQTNLRLEDYQKQINLTLQLLGTLHDALVSSEQTQNSLSKTIESNADAQKTQLAAIESLVSQAAELIKKHEKQQTQINSTIDNLQQVLTAQHTSQQAIEKQGITILDSTHTSVQKTLDQMRTHIDSHQQYIDQFESRLREVVEVFSQQTQSIQKDSLVVWQQSSQEQLSAVNTSLSGQLRTVEANQKDLAASIGHYEKKYSSLKTLVTVNVVFVLITVIVGLLILTKH